MEPDKCEPMAGTRKLDTRCSKPIITEKYVKQPFDEAKWTQEFVPALSAFPQAL